MNMNTYNELVNCQRMFRNAVLNCDDFAKKNAMNYTRSKFPDIIEDVKKQCLLITKELQDGNSEYRKLWKKIYWLCKTR